MAGMTTSRQDHPSCGCSPGETLKFDQNTLRVVGKMYPSGWQGHIWDIKISEDGTYAIIAWDGRVYKMDLKPTSTEDYDVMTATALHPTQVVRYLNCYGKW